ncbi:MAG TPA: hypothetical protein PLP23_10565 [Panacibacter sp.]|nr:hypothetical protein [Panacibacter sp.]
MSNDCSKIIRLVEDYKTASKDERSSKFLQKIAGIIGKQSLKIATKVVTKAAGAATGVGILFDILKPTQLASGSGRYHDYLKNILEELAKDNVDVNVLNKNYALLLDASNQMMIEKDFGVNSNCYKAIDNITKQIGETIKLANPQKTYLP